MKKLPIGEQNFRKLRNEKMVYVDKTQHLHRVVTSGNYYFLSRPRRFGKSLNLSTLEEMFRCSRDLFEGLWLEDNWDWSRPNPVIHISFARIGYHDLGLQAALEREVKMQADAHGVALTTLDSPGLMLRELLLKLAKQQAPVALLIDEYDKPLIDYLAKEELPTAKANRETLKAFYSVLKDSESQSALRFLFITGVSKFSQVSIFSDLNYLNDITFNPNYSTLVGYTQAELEDNFADWLSHTLARMPGETMRSMLANIKKWYNGYTWNTQDFVYNPFSILNFFDNGFFQDYWFKTGTPSFLIKLVKEKRYFNLSELQVNRSVFDSFDLENLEVRSLMFQTGYLTVKSIDWRRGVFTLGYPNREVEEAMNNQLLSALLDRPTTVTIQPVLQLEEAFLKNDMEKAVLVINTMLRDLPSHLLGGADEHFYHSLVHLLFRYLGLFIESEVHTSDGRMDAVVQTDTHIFILEFKIDQSADAALAQIDKKGYADKYRMEGKTLIGLGINFNLEKRKVDDWKSVPL